MPTVFISSVIQDYKHMRHAARQAAELMDYKPIAVETDLAAQPYSSEQACLTAVSQADLYIVVAGKRFGYENAEGLSVTQAEFRQAIRSHRPILVFVEETEAELKQQAFIDELQDYKSGFFRTTFSSPEELKEAIIRAIRQFERTSRSDSQEAFEQRLSRAAQTDWHLPWGSSQQQATLSAAWWPQPQLNLDLRDIESELDQFFDRLCASRITSKREGYQPIDARDHTGLQSGGHRVRFFEDGLVLYDGTPEHHDNNHMLPGMFVAPSRVHQMAIAAANLFDETGAWCQLALHGMQHKNFSEPPTDNQGHISIPMTGAQDVERCQCLIPYSADRYAQFVDRAIDQFDRELRQRF